MTKEKALAIVRGIDCGFIRRHPGHDEVEIDGSLTALQMVALTWLMANCPEWSIGVDE